MDVLGAILSDANYAFKVKKTKKMKEAKPYSRPVSKTAPSRAPLKELNGFSMERFANQMMKPSAKLPEVSPPQVDEAREKLRLEAIARRQEERRATSSSRLDDIFRFQLPCREETPNQVSGDFQIDWSQVDVDSLHCEFSQFSWNEFNQLGF